MIYKVWNRDGSARPWYFDFFRESIDGSVYSYEMDGSLVRSATFVVKKPIPQYLFEHYFFDYEILSST